MNGSDGWPSRHPRRVTLFADHMATGIRACESGRLLAVLPDALGKKHGLRRLPVDDLPPSPMYAMYRPFLAEGERAEVLLELVRDHV